MAPSATTPENSRKACPPTRSRNCSSSAKNISRRSTDFPEARAFWWPRFVRIAQWFVALGRRAPRESRRRCTPKSKASLKFPVGSANSHSRPSPTASSDAGRQLRHPRLQDRRSARTEKQVRTGLAPQLTLEAAILRAGEFARLARRLGVGNLLCHAERRRTGRQAQQDRLQGRHPDTQADHALARLKELAAKFENETTPYLSLRAPDVDDALRRLRPSRPRQGMVAHRRRRGGRAMTAARIIPPAVRPRAGRGRRPRRIGLRVGQCRLRQDPCAGAAGDQSAASRRRSGQNPLHHLHQGRRRQHGEPRLRHARRMDDARRRCARRGRSGSPPAAPADAASARGRAGCSPRRWKHRAG